MHVLGYNYQTVQQVQHLQTNVLKGVGYETHALYKFLT